MLSAWKFIQIGMLMDDLFFLTIILSFLLFSLGLIKVCGKLLEK